MDPLNDSKPPLPTTSLESDSTHPHDRQDPIAKSPTTESFAAQAQSLTNKTLTFLSEASNETLGACLVGLGATTYLVLGRVGLVLIGVVGGVALHAHWESKSDDGGDAESRTKEAKRRKEVGLDVAQRVLDWRLRATSADGHERVDSSASLGLKLNAGKALDYSGFKPETAQALNELTDAIIQDYVKWWYHPIIPAEEGFPASCRRTLTAFILSVSSNLSRKRPADTFLEFLTNSSSVVIVFLNELSTALTTSPSPNALESLAAYLDARPDSNLANILDQQSQIKKLDMVSEDIIQTYLDSKAYSCDPVHTFLREILAKVVLEMTIQACSTPEFINQWIVYLLEEGEPEIMNAIDAGMEGSAGEGLQKLKEEVVEPNEKAAEKADKSLPKSDKENVKNAHKRRVSRAEQAMEDAMQEAKRLTELMAEEDARKMKEEQQAVINVSTTSMASVSDDTSENTTQGVHTPTSSQSDQTGSSDPALSRHRSMDQSESDEAEPVTAKPEEPQKPFTSFDQILPPQQLTALQDIPERPSLETSSRETFTKEAAPLTLYNAHISIFDDSVPGQKQQQQIKSKPQIDYLIQIEPSNSAWPGWMIARKYADFETLHEVLRRISVIAGVGFTEAHEQVPQWKIHTKSSLRGELERYLNDAMRWRPLAESEGMKRFLEKDQGLNRSPSTTKSGFGWPAPASVGKGVINALAQAPKDIAGGGKAFVGGVAGVFGGGQAAAKRQSTHQPTPSRSSTSLSRVDTNTLAPTATATPRISQESVRNSGSPIIDKQPTPEPQMERRPSAQPEDMPEKKKRGSRPSSSSASPARIDLSREPMDLGINVSAGASDPTPTQPPLHLPPPPSEISDDYDSRPPSPTRTSTSTNHDLPSTFRAPPHSATLPTRPTRPSSDLARAITDPPLQTPKIPTSGTKTQKPLTSQETQVAVELLFAVINELYTLSSAWTFRRTLLTAAKTFLLRPGNPQLETIRVLLQDTVITANTSDAGIAGLIRKVRENALCTEAEMESWKRGGGETWEGVREGRSVEERKEELRKRARRLLVQRGMPQALTSVMGQAASGEALGKVFDCLQVERVCRGLMFGLLLQGVRAVTQ